MAEYVRLECPECQWDCIVAVPFFAMDCPLCAGDTGHAVRLGVAEGPLPDTVEGFDTRKSDG